MNFAADSLARIAEMGGTRIAVFGFAFVAIVAAGLKAVGNIAAPRRFEPRGDVEGEPRTTGECTRVRDVVMRGTRSAWERRELVGRLRVAQRKLDQCVRPTPASTFEDEARLAALSKRPLHRRPSKAQVEALADSVLALAARWEERLHRRPTEGR